ncbi:MAG: hypothetical protein H6943_05995 [Zoogloeaceae bacterium]|nr:hypothetical protein [Zoogloeaceae bacterium]
MQAILGSERDFTTEMYRKSLVAAKSCWRFIPFTSFDSPGKNILWRHDVDISVHRAHRLAEIEVEVGVRSTYFFLLHSEFYNLLSPAVLSKARSIVEMGHHLGLHFDPSIYEGKLNSNHALCENLLREKEILERYLDAPVEAFSWHNPTNGSCLTMDAVSYAGMINAYGADLRRRYRYVSDSNGVWRHERLHEVVRMNETEKLHVLTHPEWWQETAMPPRYRIYRSAWGHAKSSIYSNDQLLSVFCRENIAGNASSIEFLKGIDRRLFELFDYLWNVGHLQTLYIELWSLHKRQINLFCKAALLREWMVPGVEANAFFNDSKLIGDSCRIFQGIFGVSWQSISGLDQSAYLGWLELSNRLINGCCSTHIEVIRDGCLFLSYTIEKLASWGKAQPMNYDGLAPLDAINIPSNKIEDGRFSDCLEGINDETQIFQKTKWEKFKAEHTMLGDGGGGA